MNKFREIYKTNMSAQYPNRELIEKTADAMATGHKPRVSISHRYKWSVVIAVALLCALLVTTVAAASVFVFNFLKPGEIAEIMGDKTLSAAFENEDVIDINISIKSNGYTFTLLTIMTGKDLNDKNLFGNAKQASDERTYAVFAIEHDDKSKLIDENGFIRISDFYAAFMVKGLKPWLVNSASMNGSGYATVVDGIMYYIAESDTVEMFADRGIYFVICRGSAIYDLNAIIYDEITGEIRANPDYDGPCAIFEVPLDKSFADPEKANEYLHSIGYHSVSFDPDEYYLSNTDQIAGPATHTEWLKWKPEDMIKFYQSFDWENAVAVDSTLEELSVNADGMLIYTGFIEYYEWLGPPLSISFEDCFEDNKTAQSQIAEMRLKWNYDGTSYVVQGIRFSIDENGKITGVVVLPDNLYIDKTITQNNKTD